MSDTAGGVAPSIMSQSSSPSSTKAKRRSIFKIFGSSKNASSPNPRKSRASSASTTATLYQEEDEDDTSDDDKSIDLNAYHAAVGPVKFRLRKHHKTTHDESADLSERLNLMFDDDDYEKYLRQPKHIKTFKKSHKSAQICKRLFLAQELHQNVTTPVTGLEQLLDGSRLDDAELQSEAQSTNGTTTLNITASSLFTDAAKEDSTPDTEKTNAIWAMRFSLDGKYLASAGKGNIIRVWKVIASPLDRLELNNPTTEELITEGEEGNASNLQYDLEDKNYASVFQEQPYRNYAGHTHDILSLDWSKNNFLLSSSMDKTVRLWNVEQTKCLRTFQHRDFVPSVKFHPTDDRFFISGCLDHKVRLWSILENEVKFEFDAKNLVTAVAMTPNGTLTIAGTFNGMVFFLDTQTLDLRHSLELNKKKGENMKITGIECFTDGDDIKVLITSNDSRIRVISLRHKQMEYYLKGLDNNSSQIIATVSDDNKYIISGSENHWLYVWEVEKDAMHHHKNSHNGNGGPHGILGLMSNKKKKRSDYTSFHAHHHVITCALIAPSGTFKALSLSNDYIYELNSELSNFQAVNGDLDSKSSDRRNSSLFDDEHIGGIIVTADDHGLIRVFRQDLPGSVRKTLLSEKKRRDAAKEAQSQDQNHRLLLNKAHNCSNNSLLSRGNSMRSNFNGINSAGSTPHQGRSRSGTVDSMTQRLRAPTTGSGLQNPKKLTCEVCGGEKFAVTKGGSGLDVFCTDCGNQMRA